MEALTSFRTKASCCADRTGDLPLGDLRPGDLRELLRDDMTGTCGVKYLVGYQK